MAKIIKYYVDKNGNKYVNIDGAFYIANIEYTESPTVPVYLKYKPYIYASNNEVKKYNAYIRNADGTFSKYNPYICAYVEVAVAGLGTVGVERAAGK